MIQTQSNRIGVFVCHLGFYYISLLDCFNYMGCCCFFICLSLFLSLFNFYFIIYNFFSFFIYFSFFFSLFIPKLFFSSSSLSQFIFVNSRFFLFIYNIFIPQSPNSSFFFLICSIFLIFILYLFIVYIFLYDYFWAVSQKMLDLNFKKRPFVKNSIWKRHFHFQLEAERDMEVQSTRKLKYNHLRK